MQISVRALGESHKLTMTFRMGLAGVIKKIEKYEADAPWCRLSEKQAEFVRIQLEEKVDLAGDV